MDRRGSYAQSRMKKRFAALWIFTILLFGILTNLSAQERFVRPFDEGEKDKSFSTFRAQLILTVKRRDKKSLLNIIDPNIKASFGGDKGIKDFQKIWKINGSKSKLWDELQKVLNNGGAFIDNNTFAAPYSFTNFPEDLDAFEYQLIFGNNVNLRAAPDSKSKLIGQLSYNIVKVDFESSVSIGKTESNYEWLKITTLGGKKGFVNAGFVRSPIDYRAIFEKQKGKWRMTAFVSGD